MKKYHQLLITALGLLSFISFLIYKHEYDRLRHVLQVLEVFGSPPPPNQVHSSPSPVIIVPPAAAAADNEII